MSILHCVQLSLSLCPPAHTNLSLVLLHPPSLWRQTQSMPEVSWNFMCALYSCIADSTMLLCFIEQCHLWLEWSWCNTFRSKIAILYVRRHCVPGQFIPNVNLCGLPIITIANVRYIDCCSFVKWFASLGSFGMCAKWWHCTLHVGTVHCGRTLFRIQVQSKFNIVLLN